MIRIILRLLLAAAFAFAGYAHIINPEGFLTITPDWVPYPDHVIFWTGVAEIAGAAGLLISRLRAAAGWGLAAYTLCVWPANINHALTDLAMWGGSGEGLSAAYHIPRLLLQPVIIWWCLWAARIIDWPFRKQPR
ncbi:MAG: DoxX family protein [Pacificimonas sp.]|nr:DoxX family protein [Pacificimonas sp.]